MAIFILNNAFCTVAGTNLSTYISSITLDFAVDPIPVDSMGSNGHLFISGLQNNSVAITFNQDFAASTVAPILDGQIGLGTTTIVVKATSAATSTTNPAYTISNAFLAATQPVNGSVGDLAQMSVTFQGGTIAKTTS